MNAAILHEMGPIIISATGLFALFGGGLWRVWSILSGLRADMDNCKERDSENREKIHTMGLCLRLLIPEVARIDPGNNTLTQVRALLDQSFPVDDDTPPDMIAMLDRIDQKRRRAK